MTNPMIKAATGTKTAIKIVFKSELLEEEEEEVADAVIESFTI